MAREFTLAIVAPDKSVAEVSVSALVAPGLEGYFGVMAGHVPMVAALRPGVLEYTDASGKNHVYIGGGFVEVRPDRVTVLADEADRAADLDAAKAEAGLELARQELRNDKGSMTQADAVQEIERAIQRLRAARFDH
jgi:F-type H+-transporting ATPase subunit epsilon